MKPRPHVPIEWDAADGFHLILRLADNQPLVTSAPERRVLARVVYDRTFWHELVAFRIVETHLHLVARGMPEQVAALAQQTGAALHWRLGLRVRFQPYSIEPLFSRAQLRNAVRHVMTHDQERGRLLDPVHDGSCLPDLIGARAFHPPCTRNVFMQAFPDCTSAQLDQLAAPATGGIIEPGFLADATLSAAGLRGFGRDRESGAALCAAAHAWIGSAAETASLLRVHPTSVRRWRMATPLPRLVNAIARQLELRAALGPFAVKRTDFDPFLR